MSTFSTSSRQKRLKTLRFLHFWLRNVLRATTACTFSTLFRHLNVKKWSENGVFCTFWLGNVLRATTASDEKQREDVQGRGSERKWDRSEVFPMTLWKVASRHQIWARRRSKCTKHQMRCEKVGRSRFIMFFQWFVAPEGRKVASLKRRVRRHLARWEMKKCTPLWREAHFQVKMYKTHTWSDHFWKLHVEKVHAVVARSTFPSQKCYKTHHSRTTFGRCDVEKVSRRCGAKHISKSNVSKTEGFEPFLRCRCRKSRHWLT